MDRAEIEAAVAVAVGDRFAGRDAGHDEHRMQAALARNALRPLGIEQFAREYPAWRAPGKPGYIDFLGLDRDNRLHVVETKVGTEDPVMVLQALDYATWVTANGPAIRDDLRWAKQSRTEDVIIDIVLAPKRAGGLATSRYLAGQLEALAGDIAWRVSVVVDPLADVPKVFGPFGRRLPDAFSAPGIVLGVPVSSSRWKTRVAKSLRAQLTRPP